MTSNTQRLYLGWEVNCSESFGPEGLYLNKYNLKEESVYIVIRMKQQSVAHFLRSRIWHSLLLTWSERMMYHFIRNIRLHTQHFLGLRASKSTHIT